MTKAQEIELLTRMANEFPQDSYCGPWLRSVLAEVESDIRSDIPPSASITFAREVSAHIIQEANDERQRIIAASNAITKKQRDETIDACDAIRARLRNDLSRALETIDR